jgi:hypothetical protein
MRTDLTHHFRFRVFRSKYSISPIAAALFVSVFMLFAPRTGLALGQPKDAPGAHTLKTRMIDPGTVLERLVVSQGVIAPSYLGPPESFHGALTARQ